MNNVYPIELIELMKKFNYIPKQLRQNEHLKLYHRYWIPDFGGMIKVKDIWRENKTEYYVIKYKNDMHICFSHPMDRYDNSYELFHDYEDIYKQDIINSNVLYTGAEIKYWFALHNEKRYDKFKKYFDPNSKSFIIDNKRYKVFISKNNQCYIENSK